MNTQRSSTVLARFVTTLTLVIVQVFSTAVPVQAAPTVTRTLDQNNPGSWSLTGSMAIARFLHTATLLEDGKVLVAGGYNDSGGLTSAELYNSMTGTWSAATGMLATARQAATATRLLDGRVLITGGADDLGVPLSSAELYDPITGLWTPTAAMSTTRQTHTATLLQNGKVLVVGGNDIDGNILASAEVYDPLTGSWTTTTNPMAVVRQRHTATLLLNGKVLVSGGIGVSFIDIHTSAEIYDPATGLWSFTGSMSDARAMYSATRLDNGQVLVSGGYGFGLVAGAELYDPATGSWTPTGSLSIARYGHTATLLSNEKVLVVGGITEGGIPSGVVELYDPANGVWTTTGSPVTSRFLHTTTLLADGNVLVTGGVSDGATLASAELYHAIAPKTDQTITITIPAPTTAGAGTSFSVGAVASSGLPVSYSSSGQCTNVGAEFTILPNGSGSCQVIYNQAGDLSYYPAPTVTETVIVSKTNQTIQITMEAPDSAMAGTTFTVAAIATSGLPVTYSSSGQCTNLGPVFNIPLHTSGSCQVIYNQTGNANYNPAPTLTETVSVVDPQGSTVIGSMSIARTFHTATLLPNGQVLITGGSSNGNIFKLASAELYNPATGSWKSTGTMRFARSGHTATLLLNGKVLVAGGTESNQFNSPAELYDPTTETWTTTAPMIFPRSSHTATLLADGRVLVVGGIGRTTGSILPFAELYEYGNPTSSWTRVTSATVARSVHTATLLPNGKVLVAGGFGNPNNNDAMSSATLYAPDTNTWASTRSLSAARGAHTATLLLNGQVLVTGGSQSGIPLSSAELYNPITGTWTPTGSLATARSAHTATLLDNGKVLVAGGHRGSTILSSAELYDPTTRTWTPTGALATARLWHTATLLLNGQTLVVGGYNQNNGTSLSLTSAELYGTPLVFDPAYLIFTNGFEFGNLASWTNVTSDPLEANDPSVNAAAVLVGSFGLRINVNNNNSVYVTDTNPTAEARYRVRFYFDPNSIRMKNNDAHDIFYGNSASSQILQIQFRYLGGKYQLRVTVRGDNNNWTNTSWFVINDAAHAIELDWRAATHPSTNDGGVTLWIDGVPYAKIVGIDNDTHRMDNIQLGAISGIDIDTRGIYYFDAFESRRQSFIGP